MSLSFSETVHLYRRRARKSLRDLAKDTGVSISTLCRIESGKECEFSVAWAVIHALGIPWGEVVPDNAEGEMP